MTNTGITDPEILEYRFPVKLKEFSLRKGSGGEGKFSGGDGVIRELEFTEPVTLSLLTQHRVEVPYGLRGGGPGKSGEQWLIRKDEAPLKLKPSDRLEIKAGDRIRILTPGGGGWGNVS
jgi:5-oxoprolinase (ATP-hydrolysing)